MSKQKLYIDEECKMCQSFGRVVESVDKSVKLDSAQKGALPKGKTRKDLNESIHYTDHNGETHEGVYAVLEIFRKTWYGKVAYRLSQKPLVGKLFEVIYSIVSNNRKFLSAQYFSPANLAKNIATIGLLAGIAASWRLWFAPDDFPSLPYIESMALPASVNLVLSGVVVVSLLASLFSKKYTSHFSIASVVIFLAISFTDQTHLQPWAYMYAWIIGMVSIRNILKLSASNTLSVLRLMLGWIYVWSGSFKINPDFPDVFAWMLGPIAELNPANDEIITAAITVGLLELLMGAVLLVRKTSRIAVVGLSAMHISILYLIGPFGLDWNAVVWPWNMIMILLLFAVGWPKYQTGLKDLFAKERATFAVVSVGFILLPLLGHFGRWDTYLSFSLYSGNVSEGAVQPASGEHLKAYGFERRITVSNVATHEVGVPSYPEERVLRAYFKDRCELNDSSELFYTRKTHILEPEREFYRIDCYSVL